MFGSDAQVDDLTTWMSMAPQPPPLFGPAPVGRVIQRRDGFLEDEAGNTFGTMATNVKAVVGAVGATASAVGGVVSAVASTGVSVAKGLSSFVQGPQEEPAD